MIYSNNKKILFIAIPKTGTRSVYKYFERFKDSKVYKDHAKIVPGFNDHYKFTIVRNPYDRLVSGWWATCKRGNDRYGYKKVINTYKNRDVSFDQVCRNLKELVNKIKVPHLHPQTDWIEKNNINKIIRYENLNDEWLDLPFNNDKKPLPHINATTKQDLNNPLNNRGHITRQHYTHYLNEENIQHINNFYKKDFELLNYEFRNK